MATCERALKRSKAAVSKFKIASLPKNVKQKTVRINKKGDTYASGMYKSSTGNYAQIASAFDEIAAICKNVLNNDAFDAVGLKNELTAAKKKAEGRSKWAKERSKECKDAYNTTKDIYNMIHK